MWGERRLLWIGEKAGVPPGVIGQLVAEDVALDVDDAKLLEDGELADVAERPVDNLNGSLSCHLWRAVQRGRWEGRLG